MVASIASLLVIAIVGVALLNLALGGSDDRGVGTGSVDAGLAAMPDDASAEPTLESTQAPVVVPPAAATVPTVHPATRAWRTDPPMTASLEPPATQIAVSPEGTATTGVPAGRAPRGNAFTCGDATPAPIRDLRDRTWRVTKVSFRAMSGFERVILHLDRIGEARSGGRTVAIAGRVSTEQLAELPSDVHPERKRRGLLRVALPGVPEGPEIRAFRPLGIGNVGELSLLPGRKGRTALLTIDHDACYRIRVPEWGPSGADDARRAEVVIDIRD